MLAFSDRHHHHVAVTKRSANPPAGNYTVIGRRSDGVRILAPRGKPEHFTSREIGRSIERVVGRDSATGRFLDRTTAPNGTSKRK
jgi:hypothetical protein